MAHYSAGKTLRNPETGTQGHNSPAVPHQVQKFSSTSSLTIGFSSSICHKPVEPAVLHLQLGQLPGFLGLHFAVLLPPALVGRRHNFYKRADLDDGLDLGDQLLVGLELGDDLLRSMPVVFLGRDPKLVCRFKALIHFGSTSRVHVKLNSCPPK